MEGKDSSGISKREKKTVLTRLCNWMISNFEAIHCSSNLDTRIEGILILLFWVQMILAPFQGVFAFAPANPIFEFLQMLSGFVLIAPCLEEIGISAFWTMNLLLMAFLFVVLVLLSCAHFFHKEKVLSSLQKQFLNILGLVRVCGFPAVQSVLALMYPEKYNDVYILPYFPNENYFTVGHVCKMITGWVALLLYFAIEIQYCLIGANFDSRRRSLASRRISPINSYTMMYVIAATLGLSRFANQLTVVFTSVICLLLLFGIRAELLTDVYYSRRVNYTILAFCHLNILSLVMMILYFLFKEQLGIIIYAGLLALCPFVLGQVYRAYAENSTSDRVREWKTGIENHKLTFDSLIQLFQFLNRDTEEVAVRANLETTVKEHLETCLVRSCQAILHQKEFSSSSRSYFVHWVTAECEKFQSKIFSDVNDLVEYLLFLCLKSKQTGKAVAFIQQANMLSLPLAGKFRVKYCERILDDLNFSRPEDVLDDENIQNEHSYHSLSFSFVRELERSTLCFIDFWSRVSFDMPRLDEIRGVAFDIFKKLEEVEIAWKNLFRIKSSNRYKYFTLYGNFLINVVKDKEKAHQIITETKFLFSLLAERKNDFRHITLNDDIAEISQAIAVVSGAISSLGIIVEANLSCGILFGFGNADLIGENINILIPEVYKELHNGYLARSVKNLKSTLNHETRSLFACSRFKYLKNIRVQVKPLFSSSLLLFGRFTPERISEFQAQMLVNKDGLIDSVSSGCTRYFSFSNKESWKKKLFGTLAPPFIRDKNQFLRQPVDVTDSVLPFILQEFLDKVKISLFMVESKYDDMPDPFYVLNFRIERLGVPQMTTPSSPPIFFEAFINPLTLQLTITNQPNRSKDIVPKTLVFSRRSLTNQSRNSFLNGIGSHRLVKGTIKPIADCEDSISSNSLEEEESAVTQKLHQKSPTLLQKFTEYEQLQITRSLKSLRLPKIFKILFTIYLISWLASLTVILVSSITSLGTIGRAKNLSKLFFEYFRLRSNIYKPSSYFFATYVNLRYRYVRNSFLMNEIDRSIKSVQDSMLVFNTISNELNDDELASFLYDIEYGTYSFYDIVEKMKKHSYSILMRAGLKTFYEEEIMIYVELLDMFDKKTKEKEEKSLSLYIEELNFTDRFFLMTPIFLLVGVIFAFMAFLIVTNLHQRLAKVLLLYLEIDLQTINHYRGICENFLLVSQSANDFLNESVHIKDKNLEEAHSYNARFKAKRIKTIVKSMTCDKLMFTHSVVLILICLTALLLKLFWLNSQKQSFKASGYDLIVLSNLHKSFQLSEIIFFRDKIDKLIPTEVTNPDPVKQARIDEMRARFPPFEASPIEAFASWTSMETANMEKHSETFKKQRDDLMLSDFCPTIFKMTSFIKRNTINDTLANCEKELKLFVINFNTTNMTDSQKSLVPDLYRFAVMNGTDPTSMNGASTFFTKLNFRFKMMHEGFVNLTQYELRMNAIHMFLYLDNLMTAILNIYQDEVDNVFFDSIEFFIGFFILALVIIGFFVGTIAVLSLLLRSYKQVLKLNLLALTIPIDELSHLPAINSFYRRRLREIPFTIKDTKVPAT